MFRIDKIWKFLRFQFKEPKSKKIKVYESIKTKFNNINRHRVQ